MVLGKKSGIACAVVVAIAASSVVYVKKRGEDYITDGISDLEALGLTVQEQQRNDGLFDFKRTYEVQIDNPAQLLGAFTNTARLATLPMYLETLQGNSFTVDMNYMPWTMEGVAEVVFNSPSEKLVEELKAYPLGHLVIRFIEENGITLYSDIERGETARLGIRDIDYSTEDKGTEFFIGLHDLVAVPGKKDKIVSHLGDVSLKAVQGTEEFVWSAKGIDHTMESAKSSFDFHTLFAMENSELSVKVNSGEGGEGNFTMGFSGVKTDSKVENLGDALFARETSSIDALSFQFEEAGIASEVMIEGLHLVSEVRDVNKVAVENFITLLQSYKEGDEPALEKALLDLLHGGGRFILEDFSVAKTEVKAKDVGIHIETGAAQLTADLAVTPNTYDPQMAPPLALAENLKASLDFEMLEKDYETLKTLSGMGMMVDGFVVKENKQAKVNVKFDGKNLTVNGQPLM